MSKRRSAWDEGRRAWTRLTDWHKSARADDAHDNGDEALGALTDICRVRQLLDQAELIAVKTARAQGRSWAEIATMLGVTRQSAWEKWRDLDDASAPESGTAGPAHADVGADFLRETVEHALFAPEDEPEDEWDVVIVPDLIGQPWADAGEVLAEVMLTPAAPANHAPLPPRGESGWVVVDQTPRGGARRTPGSLVTVWVERGGGAGVREPRRPAPTPRAARGERDEQSQEAVG